MDCMKRNRSARVALLSILLSAGIALAAVDPPEAPPGFSWRRLVKIKAAFLVPDGWHFMRGEQENTTAFFITRENIEEVGSFDTGLSINVIRDRPDLDAVAYARSYIVAVLESNEVIGEPFANEVGRLKGFGAQVKVAGDEERPDIVMHYLAIGNSETNTLYILFFESPEPRWEEDWKTGQTMLRFFLLDDEV